MEDTTPVGQTATRMCARVNMVLEQWGPLVTRMALKTVQLVRMGITILTHLAFRMCVIARMEWKRWGLLVHWMVATDVQTATLDITSQGHLAYRIRVHAQMALQQRGLPANTMGKNDAVRASPDTTNKDISVLLGNATFQTDAVFARPKKKGKMMGIVTSANLVGSSTTQGVSGYASAHARGPQKPIATMSRPTLIVVGAVIPGFSIAQSVQQ